MNKSVSRYLPSKKFIISLSILLAIVALFFGIRFIAQKAAKNIDPSKITVSNLMNPVEVDTDGDGIYDWEEALWGTDPKNPDSNADGIPDSAEITRKKNELGLTTTTETGEATETDAFARDIYTTIAVAAQGGLTEEKSAELQNDIAKYIVNKKPSEPAYTLASLALVPETTNANIEYINAMTAFFKNNDQIRQLLETTTNEVKNGTIDPAYFTTASGQLIAFGKQLSRMQVPQPAANIHVEFANAFNNLGIILGGMAKIDTDPLLAFSYGIEHQDALLKLSVAYANIGNYFTSLAQ